MAPIPESARAVLEGPALAHLVTLEPDGRPQISIVWIGLDGDELVAAHLPEHRKIRNIRRDPRVALSVEAGTHNEMGLAEYVVTPDVLDGTIDARVDALLTAGPQAVRLQKKLIRDWEDMTLSQAVRAGIESFKQAYATDEPARMMSSFNRARKKKK